MGHKELSDDGMERITEERTVLKESTTARYYPLPIIGVRV
jgi:hypothetical protein